MKTTDFINLLADNLISGNTATCNGVSVTMSLQNQVILWNNNEIPFCVIFKVNTLNLIDFDLTLMDDTKLTIHINNK